MGTVDQRLKNMKIDIEEIMQEIRKDIQDREIPKTDVCFEEINIDLISSKGYSSGDHIYKVKQLRDLWDLNAVNTMSEGNSIGVRLRNAVKRQLVKAMRPYFTRQSEINAVNSDLHQELMEYIRQQDETIKRLSQKIEELEKNK